MENKNIVSSAASRLLMGYYGFSKEDDPDEYPSLELIVNILQKIKMAMFPGYFREQSDSQPVAIWMQGLLETLRRDLTHEITTALRRQNDLEKADIIACRVTAELLDGLADIQQMLYKDARAGYEGDPAAGSIDEVVLTYPGFYAVFIHRIAHFLYSKGIPIIPRMMSGHAHSKTGIDIHPGAHIGEYFFIDHGTGVVIGETSVIGCHVKLYQGVTLGALSTKGGQKLNGMRRHPKIEDHVTIYAGATILGGETVIGKNMTIRGNTFITESVFRDSSAIKKIKET